MSIQDSINLGFRNRWSSLKRLNNAITSVLLSKSSRNVHELESLLQHHKPDLISLASNPPRNNQHKQLVQNASKDGITIVMQQRSHKEILSREIVEEALLMADMFDLNELICLELIITGERQMPRYPGAARGPVAVMLYYDSKRTVLQIMKLLLQGLGGRTWSANFPKEVQKLVSSFVLALQAEGIVGKALERLEKIDTKTEFEILQKNKALGPVKFKKQVFDFIIDIKELYADLIFSFFAQYDASSLDLQRLVKLLATTCDLSSRGSLEKISTTLLMSLLYAIEVSGLQNLERSEAAAKQYPAVKFDTLIKDALDATARQSFKIVGITSVIDFAAGISLKTLNKYAGKVETGEDVIDRALEANAFEAISRILAKNPYIRDDEFYSRRVHGILMDFQFVFPDRMKDMRDKGDEMGHILAMYTAEGIQPPASLDRLFEKFLHLLAEFYQKDPHHLTAEIWKNSLEDDMFAERNTTFIKFLKNTIETQLPQVIHIPVLKVLAAFARSAPFQIYNLLRHTEPSQKSSFNFDNFFRMLHIYLNSIRGLEKLPLQAGLQAGSLNPGAIINATELEILCAVLELIEAIASNDRNCALALSENQQFNCIQTLVGLLVGPVARKMKATILSCLGGIAEKTPSIALSIWLRLDVVLPKPQLAASGFASSQQQRSWQNGICIEIEDIEPRSEEYVITLSFLKAMNSLIKFVICNREPQIQGSIEYALNFIISGVFLKLDSRNYKSEDEKWELVASCLDLFAFLLEFYEPLSDSNSIRASFSLMNQILQESGLFRSIMRIIEGVTSLLEPDVAEPKVIDPIISKYMQQSLVTSLKIMTSIASKQSDFQIVISEIPGFPSAALVSVPTLFANINPRKGEADRLATLLRIVSLPFPFIQKEVLKLLRCLIVDDSSISNHCLLQLLPIKIVHEDYLFHGFVDCLSESSSLRLEALLMIRDYLQSDSKLLGSYGLSYRLLGFDSKKKTLRPPGSQGQTFNCFHAIISFVQGEIDCNSEERSVCLDIIYLLCSDPETSAATLRFLRTSYELISSYLSRILLDRQLIYQNLGEVGRFWRILATEIKHTNDANLRSHCSSYVKLLLGDSGLSKPTELVSEHVFVHEQPDMPTWEFFDGTELWKTLSECSNVEGSIDVKLLHQKLLNEVRQLGPQLGTVQANLIQQEIKHILAYTSKLNASKDELNEKLGYFEGWRELVEVMVIVPCLNVFEDGSRVVILLELIHELLLIASHDDLCISSSYLQTGHGVKDSNHCDGERQ
ncbi:Nuclear pore complex protein [Halotydeus destructor]|nr:Nuclear pore complex protein [Halotydeus destructor]